MFSSEFYPKGYKKEPIEYYSDKKILDFFIAGYAKCGTTSLMFNLPLHPNIFVAPKETKYWTGKDHSKNIEEHFKEWYPSSKNNTIWGEKDPGAARKRESLQKLKEHNPLMKIIMILREPVSRALSEYNHRTQHNEADGDWKIKGGIMENSSLLKGGEYMTGIRNVLEFFPRDQLLVVISENLKETPAREMQRIFDFLNLPRTSIQFEEDVHKREYITELSDTERKLLEDYYKTPNTELSEFLGFNPWK